MKNPSRPLWGGDGTSESTKSIPRAISNPTDGVTYINITIYELLLGKQVMVTFKSVTFPLCFPEENSLHFPKTTGPMLGTIPVGMLFKLRYQKLCIEII